MLLALAAIASQAFTPVAFSQFNGASIALYAERGNCPKGQAAKFSTEKGAFDVCWSIQDDRVVLDIGSALISIPKSQFTIIQLKPSV